MNLWQDVQFSFGKIRRSPRVGVTVLWTLALGISLNTVVAERRPIIGASNSGTDVGFKSANTALSSLSIELVSLQSSAGFLQLSAAEPKPKDATRATIDAFDTHNIVMFGETHGNKQEHEWLRTLISTPEFEDRVDDIVVELLTELEHAVNQ